MLGMGILMLTPVQTMKDVTHSVNVFGAPKTVTVMGR